MKSIITISIVGLALFFSSCGEDTAKTEVKVDKHQEVLDAYNKQVAEYNNSVQAVCDCLAEKGSVQACRQKYNDLKFTFTPDMDKYLAEEEFNPLMIEEGNAKIDLCEAEVE